MGRPGRAGLRGDQAAVVPAAGGRVGPAALRGDDPFIMQADGKGWLFVPNGLQDGPMPTHYEPHESPFRNALYGQQGNPTRKVYGARRQPVQPVAAGAAQRGLPVRADHLAADRAPHGRRDEPQPAVPVRAAAGDVRRGVAAAGRARAGWTHLGWATLVTSRSAIEARVLVTERLRPLRVQDRVVHQVWVPYHWGYTGLVTGDSANDLFGIVARPERADPGVEGDHRATSGPGAGRTGKELLALVADYRQRAGITRRDRDRGHHHRPGRGQAAPGGRARPGGVPWLTTIALSGPQTDPAGDSGYADHPPRKGFFTDTSICIGCKACEVACKQWNGVPDDGFDLLGMSYDNTGGARRLDLAARGVHRAAGGASRPGAGRPRACRHSGRPGAGPAPRAASSSAG